MSSPIRIKTFRTKTLQDAFQQIRLEFGPDASILETKAARYGVFGRSRIEVTASSGTQDKSTNDRLQDADSLSIVPVEKKGTMEQATDETVADKHAAKIDIADTNEPSVADKFLPGLSNQPSSNLSDRKTTGREHVFHQIHQELIDAGIAPGIASQWIEAIRYTYPQSKMVDVWTVRSELQGWIRDFIHAAPPLILDDSKQQVIALVGPSGTGKTTTLAKIAANLSMEQEISVGVLSTDALIGKPNPLLQKYAEILGWQFESVDSISQVSACMKELSSNRFIFVDTNGCSPSDSTAIEKLNALLALVSPTETHLVVSSTTNDRSFLRYEQGFRKLEPSRMILTKLDEAGGLGPLFSCLQSSSLPISFLTNGQQIPADLIQATASRLAQQIMADS